MIRQLTLALCLAGASAMTASAVEMTDEFYGFGTQVKGSFYEINYVSFGEAKVANAPEEIGDEWNWTPKMLFGCNFNNNGWASKTINSGWIKDGTLYAVRAKYDNFNDLITMDAEGNLLNTVEIGMEGKYGYVLKAVLNPSDDMVYCWTTNYSSVYFGKLAIDEFNNFDDHFQQLTSFGYDMSDLPIALCVKDNVFYHITPDQSLYSTTVDGNITKVGTLRNLDDFTPSEWSSISNTTPGLGMIYSEELGKFIWSAPCGLDGTSAGGRVYAFTLPETPLASIQNEKVAVKNCWGANNNNFAYWTAFLPKAELKAVELGTPKAPATVTIEPTDDVAETNRYKISWSPVTECVEEGMALDTPHLTYRVMLNEDVIAPASTETTIYTIIEQQKLPVEYTAHVWAVCPNAQSEEATSNTITVDALVGVDGIATDNATVEIYTLDGAKVNVASAAELPAGIYVINGVKTVVK